MNDSTRDGLGVKRDMGLAVVIPTRDRTDYLDRCLASLRGGRLVPDEVVVVDTSSTGDTRHLLESWATKWAAVRYVAGGRMGVSRARNIGAQATTSQLILATDDDALIHEDCLSSIVSAFDDDPEMVALCGSVLPYGDAQKKVSIAVRDGVQRREWRGKTRPWQIGSGINLSYRRKAFEAIGGYDEEIGPGTVHIAAEDIDLLYRFLVDGGKVVYEPSVAVYHDQWRSPSQARRRRAEYERGIAAFLTKQIVLARDGYAVRLALARVWEDVPGLALAGLRKRSLESEIVSLYHLWGLVVGFWVAGRYYARRTPSSRTGASLQGVRKADG